MLDTTNLHFVFKRQHYRCTPVLSCHCCLCLLLLCTKYKKSVCTLQRVMKTSNAYVAVALIGMSTFSPRARNTRKLCSASNLSHAQPLPEADSSMCISSPWSWRTTSPPVSDDGFELDTFRPLSALFLLCKTRYTCKDMDACGEHGYVFARIRKRVATLDFGVVD